MTYGSGNDGNGGGVRPGDPPTSHLAAMKVNNKKLEALVVEWLREHPGPWTAAEVADGIGWPRDWISPRFKSLLRQGLVRKVGEKECINPNGNRATMEAYIALIDPEEQAKEREAFLTRELSPIDYIKNKLTRLRELDKKSLYTAASMCCEEIIRRVDEMKEEYIRKAHEADKGGTK